MTKDYRQLILDKMYNSDAYSQALGMDIVEVELGRCVVEMTIKPPMCNGFDVAHGSIAYALADSAAAFAANTYEGTAVTVDNRMAYHGPVRSGDLLRAIARQKSRSKRITHYHVEVFVKDELVASLQSTLYVTGIK